MNDFRPDLMSWHLRDVTEPDYDVMDSMGDNIGKSFIWRRIVMGIDFFYHLRYPEVDFIEKFRVGDARNNL